MAQGDPSSLCSYEPRFGAPPPGPQENRPTRVDLEAIQRSLSSTPTTALPQLASLVRKQARTETPSQTTAAHVEDVTGTPRSTRIRNLLPGKEEDRSLNNILDKLLSVTMAGIQFNGKGRMAKKIQIDVEYAADILVLVGAAFDQHQMDLSKRVLFQPGRRQVNNPVSEAVNTAQRPNTPHLDFQSAELTSKIDALAEQVASLTTAIQKSSPQGKQAPSYALAASKHAPASARTNQAKGPS